MEKVKLGHIAKILYDLQEYCAFNSQEPEKPYKECPAKKNGVCDLFVACHGVPQMWEITKADIKRLDGESNALDRYEDCDTNGELNNGAYRTWLAKRLGDSDGRE